MAQKNRSNLNFNLRILENNFKYFLKTLDSFLWRV